MIINNLFHAQISPGNGRASRVIGLKYVQKIEIGYINLPSVHMGNIS
jgi:hypothetical protein